MKNKKSKSVLPVDELKINRRVAGAFVFVTALAILLSLGSTFFIPPAKSAGVDPSLNGTRIETDQKAGIVRIFVAGKEAVTIDAAGLHVVGDIDYTGIVTDTGRAVRP